MCNLILYLFFIYFIAGYSSILDKLFALYMTFFTGVVLPAFYLHGDVEFRADVENNGYLRALKNSLFV